MAQQFRQVSVQLTFAPWPAYTTSRASAIAHRAASPTRPWLGYEGKRGGDARHGPDPAQKNAPLQVSPAPSPLPLARMRRLLPSPWRLRVVGQGQDRQDPPQAKPRRPGSNPKSKPMAGHSKTRRPPSPAHSRAALPPTGYICIYRYYLHAPAATRQGCPRAPLRHNRGHDARDAAPGESSGQAMTPAAGRGSINRSPLAAQRRHAGAQRPCRFGTGGDTMTRENMHAQIRVLCPSKHDTHTTHAARHFLGN